MLGPLAYNGGTTRTHALLAGSPAIDAGSNPLGLTTDQRGAGFPRVVGGASDMGAYESGTPIPFTNFAYLSQFGSNGSDLGQFSVPVGVAIDPTTRSIVVVDSSNHRVQIFNSTGSDPSQFGSVGSRQWAVQQSVHGCNRSNQSQHRRDRPRQPPRPEIQLRWRVSEQVRLARQRHRPVSQPGRHRDPPRATRLAWSTTPTIACSSSIPRMRPRVSLDRSEAAMGSSTPRTALRST